jgi:hypothetical protein
VELPTGDGIPQDRSGDRGRLLFEDADLDAAVEGALLAKMRNTGEACTAANRFLVHEAIADAFARRLGQRMAGMPVGPAPRSASPSVHSSTRWTSPGSCSRTGLAASATSG